VLLATHRGHPKGLSLPELGSDASSMVELVGIEPTTSSLRTMRSAVSIRLIRFDLPLFSALKRPVYWNRNGTGFRLSELGELLDRLPLRSRHDLRVNVHGCAGARVPHLCLRGFHVDTSLH
jgi:hypothetical protein